jgi:hypothetical protein
MGRRISVSRASQIWVNRHQTFQDVTLSEVKRESDIVIEEWELANLSLKTKRNRSSLGVDPVRPKQASSHEKRGA